MFQCVRLLCWCTVYDIVLHSVSESDPLLSVDVDHITKRSHNNNSKKSHDLHDLDASAQEYYKY